MKGRDRRRSRGLATSGTPAPPHHSRNNHNSRSPVATRSQRAPSTPPPTTRETGEPSRSSITTTHTPIHSGSTHNQPSGPPQGTNHTLHSAHPWCSPTSVPPCTPVNPRRPTPHPRQRRVIHPVPHPLERERFVPLLTTSHTTNHKGAPECSPTTCHAAPPRRARMNLSPPCQHIAPT